MLWLAKDTNGPLCLFTGTYPPDWDSGKSMMNQHEDSDFLGYVNPEEFDGVVPPDGVCLPVTLVERKGK